MLCEEGADEGGGSTSTIPHLASQEGADFDPGAGSRQLQNATFVSPSASISTIGRNMETTLNCIHANLTFSQSSVNAIKAIKVFKSTKLIHAHYEICI